MSSPNVIPVGQEPPPMVAPARPKSIRQPPRRQPGGRFAVLNKFVDATMRDLGRAEALIWLALYRDTKPDGLATAAAADLATRAGCHLTTAKNALKKLMALGLLDRVRRGSLYHGPSCYRVNSVVRKEQVKTE